VNEIYINQIIEGNCLGILPKIEENSIDSCVTDPPYGIGFMGKEWDKTQIAFNMDLWKEIFRVLKPGAHLLSFGGTRTYHRMACAVEDAGFEIRDQIQWIYGSGFPKSLDVSKSIDKMENAEREKIPNPLVKKQTAHIDTIDYGDYQAITHIQPTPITKDAKKWSGWGTALKPANEPIVLARKPLSEKTIALNVLKWGTGALNIDESRIGTGDDKIRGGCIKNWGDNTEGKTGFNIKDRNDIAEDCYSQGRFPSNVLLDEEAAKILDDQSGFSSYVSYRVSDRGGTGNVYTIPHNTGGNRGHADSGGASRFFYCAKASREEREKGLQGFDEKEVFRAGHGNEEGDDVTERFRTKMKNYHPTVKPVNLMRYLIKLITPPSGVVLDPFIGSGTTAIAARKNNFRFIGIEIEPDYVKIARRRVASLPVPLTQFPSHKKSEAKR